MEGTYSMSLQMMTSREKGVSVYTDWASLLDELVLSLNLPPNPDAAQNDRDAVIRGYLASHHWQQSQGSLLVWLQFSLDKTFWKV